MPEKLFAFVLMPFSPAFDDVYKLGIKQTIESRGHIAERVDDQIFRNETILERIKNQIAAADFIVADMSGNNPNVYYEVGFAHAKEKECILIANNIEEIRFDLKHHRHIEYNNVSSLKSKLDREVADIAKEFDIQAKDLSIDINVEYTNLETDKHKATAVADFSIEFSNKTKKDFEITNIYFYTRKNWKLFQENIECAHALEGDTKRHQIVPQIGFIQKIDGWSKTKFRATSVVGFSWDKEGIKESYDKSGFVNVKVITKQKNFTIKKHMKIICDTIPF